MRALPTALKAALDSGLTTLCHCWRVTRTDGVVLGFTDHDGAIEFDGVMHEARTGLNAEAAESALGLSIDSQPVSGALSSDAITDEDIERGLYDGAEVTVWLVDWREPSNRLLLSKGRIGEIRRGDGAFEAEVVGLSEVLNQPYSRAYLPTCDRRLGDAKCGVDLESPLYSGTGTVSAVQESQRFVAAGLDAFERGWFDNGRIEWTSGANAGLSGHVKLHTGFGDGAAIELWLSPPMPVAPGDGFVIRAGCDKTLRTCREKFANLLNFRGFPHMPGDDWVASYVKEQGPHDGGSLVGG